MNAPISFVLKRPKTTGKTAILMCLYHRYFNRHGRFIYGTGVSIKPAFFDPVTGRPTKDKAILKGASREQQRELTLLDDRLNEIYSATRDAFEFFNYHHKPFTAETIRRQLEMELRKGTGELSHTDISIPLNEYIEDYIKDLRAGKRVTESGKVLAEGSIKNYLGFQSQFNEFQAKVKRSLSFNDINQEFYHDFLNFLNGKGYSPNTIGKHTARLKKIMRDGAEEGLHHNMEFDKSAFRVLHVNTEHIYLNADEVERIRLLDIKTVEIELPVNPKSGLIKKKKFTPRQRKDMELSRDIFLIGCYLAQRISDYNAIKPENIGKTSKGKRVVKLIQKKTGESVMIPIRPELEEILHKYNYSPPKVKDQKLNEFLKLIGKAAEINEPVEIEEIKGGRKIRRTAPKYELIQSHTARRTGATNMYLAGIPPIDIMKITGHKKESNFMKYIKVTKEETADKLADHPYFQ